MVAGGQHSMVLTRDGDVFTWGWGHFGQLGHGNTGDQLVPKRGEGSLVITAEGRVLAFGCNGDEQYAYSDEEELDEPVHVVDGRLGLGAAVIEALTPTAINGITIGEGEEGKEGKEE